ncbi:M28 family metallopeptidase [candidate division KSB1 bacterium]
MKKHRIFFAVLILLINIHAFPQDKSGVITPLPGLIEDAGRLDQDTNEARLEVIKSILNQKNIPFETETFAQERNKKYPRSEGTNIVVTIGAGEREIVLGAHWDAIWLRNDSLSGAIVDNGCSVIILIRLAETLREMDLNHRIRIVLFDMEEIGLFGSSAYMEKHKDDKIDYMINLDVCGAGNTILFRKNSIPGNSSLYSTLKRACIDENINFMGFPRFPVCDEGPFLRKGIPALMISLAPEEDAHRFWLSMNSSRGAGFKEGFWPTKYISCIHSPDDTAEMADPVGMTICYKIVLETVKRLDKN